MTGETHSGFALSAAVASLRGLVALAYLLPAPAAAVVAAQAPPLVRAAETITETDVARHVEVLADDSMLGRATPSRGLDLTAAYVENEFMKLGLAPGGSPSEMTWTQRYPLRDRRHVDRAASRVAFIRTVRRREKGVVSDDGSSVTAIATASFAAAARPAADVLEVAEGSLTNPAGTVVLSGRHTPASLRSADIQGQHVLYIPPAGLDPAGRRKVVEALYGSRQGQGVIVLSDEDSVTFASRVRDDAARPVSLVHEAVNGVLTDRGWAAHVWPGAIARFLAAAGVDVARAQGDTTPVVRHLPGVYVSLDARPAPTADPIATAPNVVGILEGSDSTLKREYVVLVAHMDAGGIRRGSADSIANGADDNASGVAGLLALAKAFTQPGARPRRSVIFLATGGGATDLGGSRYYFGGHAPGPVVAVINLDMIGRAAGDTVAVAGMSDLELAKRLDWIAAEHPELRLTPVDGGSAAAVESDHLPAVRKSIPALHFSNGRDEGVLAQDVPAGGDVSAAIDAQLAARIVRFVFYVTHEIGVADRRPRWSSEGRRRRAGVGP